MATDEFYMQRCLQLAKNGMGSAFPNPLVGCVIVHQNKIIGEGFHFQPGAPHAEVNAINSVENPELLKDSTLYVNLEPCSHYGKTPPCSDLIIEKEIPNIVIGTVDPSAKVSGKGIKKLFTNGCQLNVGVLEDECEELNKRFFTFHNKNRPYVILKWAQTESGYFAPANQQEEKPFWISNQYAKQLTHKYRAEEMAILVGKNTALKDNPSLTTREWSGTSPFRILIDPDLTVPDHFELLNQKEPTIIFCRMPKANKRNIFYEGLNFDQALPPQILKTLKEYSVQSIIIEGGGNTLQQFIDSKLWDEARVFSANLYLEKGLKAPKLNVPAVDEKILTSAQNIL